MVDVLNRDFIPVVIDSFSYRSSRDDVGRFFQGFSQLAALNRINADTRDRSYQGHYVVHADGKLLAADNHRGTTAILELLAKGARHYRVYDPRSNALPARFSDRDRKHDRSPPPDTTILKVYSRVTDPSAQQPKSHWGKEAKRWNDHRTGLDHLWITRSELKAMVPTSSEPGTRYRAPKKLVRRVALYHLVDTVRGEGPCWSPRNLKTAKIELTVRRTDRLGRWIIDAAGEFELDASNSEYPRTFVGKCQGELAYNPTAEEFERIDLLATGNATGSGRYNPGAPADAYLLDVGFELPPTTPETTPTVPPQNTRSVSNYLNP